MRELKYCAVEAELIQVIFQKKNKGTFKAYYCLLKIRRVGQFFLGFYFPFFCCLCVPFRKKSGNKILLSRSFARGLCKLCSIPPPHLTISVSKSCIQRSTVLAAGIVESALLCCCCKKPVSPGSLLLPNLELGRSLGSLPCFTRWYQMQDTC